jgi:Homeodomain-like domain
MAPKRGSYLSAVKRGAILARAAEGKSQRQIAREVPCNRRTVARILSAPEVKAMLNQTDSELHSLLLLAVKVYEKQLKYNNPQVATNLFVGLQVFKPKSQHDVTRSSPLDEELERRGLAGRSVEDLRYFSAHGYMPDEEEEFDGRRLGEGLLD